MNERIEQRVILLLGLMVAIIVFVASSSVHNLQETARSEAWVNKSQDVINQANAVVSSLHAGDSAVRNYLLTGNAQDQEAYRAAYGEMLKHLAQAKALTRHGEEEKLQAPQVGQLENLIGQRVEFSRSLVHARESGGLEAAQVIIAAQSDIPALNTIQRLVLNIDTEEYSLLKARDTDVFIKGQAMQATVYTGVVANFVLLAVVVWLMRDDLAARRRAALALEEANAHLESRVKERTHELATANATLKQENLERKWSNQSLEHQLRYNQLIINSVDELVFVISKALNISRINPAVSLNTNWEPQEIVAQSLDRVLQLGPESTNASTAGNPFTTAMQQGREIKNQAALLLTKSGKTAPVRCTMVPLHDQDKVVGAVVTVRMQNGSLKPA
jgi:CHASE3 domain sensor protein